MERADPGRAAARRGIHPERIRRLNGAPPRRGRYVLYWMQAAQRERCNHALEYAALQANARGLPLLVCFGLTDRYPGANLRHYAFLLDGLCETASSLASRGIRLAVQRGGPDEVAIQWGREASLVVTDRGYTRLQRKWRKTVAEALPSPVIQVEGEAVVPVESALRHEAYAAASLRPRIHARLEEFLVPLRRTMLARDSLGLAVGGEALDSAEALATRLDLDRSVPPLPATPGGTRAARRRLRRFLREGLGRYEERRNDPNEDEGTSQLSPYLHFGQISPVEIALAARRAGAGVESPFLEQLIVRRELALNFVLYNSVYDAYKCLPAWARATLAKHARDPRPARYAPAALEAAKTEDPYWNAAQRQMVRTGFMHNTMRMYWGKKILEWSATPERAFRTALALNDRYELDGRDPNGYAGVAWCFGKHDRPWGERPVFGLVRYMNDRGLRRKFDADAYARCWSGEESGEFRRG